MTVRRVVPLVAVLAFVNACGDDSPMSPSGNPPPGDNPPAATRVISLSGDMNFGIVEVGRYSERYLLVHNSGNANLNLTGFSVSGAAGVFSTANATQTVAPDRVSIVAIRFTPTEATTYSGTFTVTGNFTGGTNTHTFSGAGATTAGPWTEGGTGVAVFDIPTFVARVGVVATSSGPCEPFAVFLGDAKVVDQTLGTCSGASGTKHQSVHLTSGGAPVEINSSPSVSWTFTEVR